MKGIAFVGFAFLSLLSGSCLAEAADLGVTKAPQFLPPPPFSWTGFYVGGNVGAGFGTTETSVDVGSALTAITGTPIAVTVPLTSQTFNGFAGGVQAGYNWQAGVFVVGIEGGYEAANLQGNAPCALILNCTMKHNWIAISGRVGVVAVERSLIVAAASALREMIVLIERATGLSAADAYSLCSIAADMHVTHLVNLHKGIHVMLAKSALQKPALRKA
jgi:outer membrane immunogenic protein